MRIIGGDLKGKSIIPPSGFTARPTTDKAKEGLFNVLINQYDFEEEGLRVLDLFSGTGSISYEFYSRGCRDIYSIEMNAGNAAFIKRTAAQMAGSSIQVVHHNVFDFIKICKIDFDIIFADPPYDLAELDSIPEKIFAKGMLKEDGLLILEHPASYSFKDKEHFIKEKKYGNVHFSFFRI